MPREDKMNETPRPYAKFKKPDIRCCGLRVELADPPEARTWKGICPNCGSVYVLHSLGTVTPPGFLADFNCDIEG